MNRKYRYSKNLPPPIETRIQVSNQQRGHQQQRYDSDYSQHDDRQQQRSRPSRANRTFNRGSGRNPRNFSRNNNARHNNNSNNRSGNNPFQLSHVNRDEETFKVTIVHGDRYDQHYLIELLRSNLSNGNSVIFYCYAKLQGSALFYVIGADTADTLRNLSRRIVTNTGQRLVILTAKAPLPSSPLDDRCKETIKAAMSRLYDPNSLVMDLSDFRNAEEFKSQGLFIAVGKPNVLRTIVDIIGTHTPNLVALVLRDNKINFIENLKPLAANCPSLRALDLSKNKIHNAEEISHLRNLDLVELVLEGNPFVDEFSSPAVYISSIRKLFKNLKKLDNEDLPTEIGFDLGVTQNLPEPKDNFIPESINRFVYEFLEAYYKIFDSDNRQALMQAYHDQATFTHSYSRSDQHSQQRPSDVLLRESHNLLRLRDESQWVKFVKSSNLDIVSFLCKFPVTQHDPASFQIDIPFFEPTFVVIVVNGVYHETFRTNKPLRSFCRTFFIVPQGSGFVIVNDMFQISNPSAKQSIAIKSGPGGSSSSAARTVNNRAPQDRVMSDIPFAPSQAAIAAVTSGGSSRAPIGLTITANFNGPQASTSAPTPTPPPAALTMQEEVIHKFMAVTSMNREFALKCLEENQFNADTAYDVFRKLQENNMIPAQAFIK